MSRTKLHKARQVFDYWPFLQEACHWQHVLWRCFMWRAIWQKSGWKGEGHLACVFLFVCFRLDIFDRLKIWWNLVKIEWGECRLIKTTWNIRHIRHWEGWGSCLVKCWEVWYIMVYQSMYIRIIICFWNLSELQGGPWPVLSLFITNFTHSHRGDNPSYPFIRPFIGAP